MVYPDAPDQMCLILIHIADVQEWVIIKADRLRWKRGVLSGKAVRCLSLQEIGIQIQNMGYNGVFYVWQDDLFDGYIYQYGNHPENEHWEIYAVTEGCA